MHMWCWAPFSLPGQLSSVAVKAAGGAAALLSPSPDVGEDEGDRGPPSAGPFLHRWTAQQEASEVACNHSY